MGERYEEPRAHLLWGPVIETLKLFLPPPLMPSIKYWYLEVCTWHSPHICKLGTDVIVPLLQIFHRTLLRIEQTGDKQSGAHAWDAMKVGPTRLRGWAYTQVHTAYLELLVVIPVMDNYKSQVKAAAEVKEVVSFCFSPSIIVEIELVLLL